ncbi:MAG TPA: branched-chain amino acid ABC transporter permease [Micromonosporaceae bacterium]
MSDVATVTTPPTRRRLIKPSLRWPVGLLIAAVVIFFFYYLDTYFADAVPDGLSEFMHDWFPLLSINEALVYVMCALGLNVVVGYAGLLDLGFVAFWAIGGYTVGWLMSGFFHGFTFRFFGSKFTADNNIPGIHINFWTVLIAAALVCALFGVIIGAPTLRLRSDYLALVTLGFGEITYEFFFNGSDIFGKNITNGNQGITPVDSVRFFGFDQTGALTWKDLGPFDALPKFVLFCALTAVVMFASMRIREGRLGRAWLAIREDELAASAMGVPLMRTKLKAYAIGAVAGGIGGAAFAIHVSGVLPDRFRFDISITLLAMVVLGGMGNVWGVTVGALLLAWTNSTALPRAEAAFNDTFRDTFGRDISFQFLLFGSVLVLMMLFRREGFIPEARTRLVLREPGRTEAESLGADMEAAAPELEELRRHDEQSLSATPAAGGRHTAGDDPERRTS